MVRCLICFATDHFFSNRWLSGTSSSGSCAVWRLGVGRMISLAVRLAEKRPTQTHRDKLMTGFSKALEGQALPRLPDELIKQLRQLDNPPLVLRVRLGNAAALDQALADIADATKPAKDRVELIRAASDIKADGLKPSLLSLVQTESNADVVVLDCWRYNDSAIQRLAKRWLTGIQVSPQRPSRRLFCFWPTALVESPTVACRGVGAPGQARHCGVNGGCVVGSWR
ncbi:MAG: hypothetical protein CM1200mP29_04450 [Verrucomicrobiota bacterium]|nr:MAG: hypothetical protein CM1200mP29_04450 [Verrucomicrobiota bacterium]